MLGIQVHAGTLFSSSLCFCLEPFFVPRHDTSEKPCMSLSLIKGHASCGHVSKVSFQICKNDTERKAETQCLSNKATAR